MEELLLSSDFEKSLANIEQYVKTILYENDAKKTKPLWLHFQKLMNLMYFNEGNSKRPREPDGTENQSKKLKLESVLTRFPNEMWIKILTYLPTKNIFGGFAQVSKRFNYLTTSIKCLHWNFEIYLEKVKITLERSIYLTALIIENSMHHGTQTYSINESIKYALLVCPRLKFIRVSRSKDDNACSFSTEVKKYAKALEKIEFKNFQVDGKTLIEISKLETLKSVAISTKWAITFKPKFIKALAESKNQLEAIDFQLTTKEPSNKNELRSNLNDLLKMKSQTITYLGLEIREKSCKNGCVPLKNLSLCKNLETYNGYLHSHDFVYISEVPRLKTLNFDCQYHNWYGEVVSLLNQLDLSALKHLSIHYNAIFQDKKLFKTIANICFPSLERFYIHPNDTSDYHRAVKEENFKDLVKNAPNLRIVEIGENLNSWYITNEYVLQILEDRNIFVQFEDSTRQSQLENFLQQKQAYQMYKVMKKKSLRWRETKVSNSKN